MAATRGHLPDPGRGRDPEAARRRRGDRPGPHHRHPRPDADPHLRPGAGAADGPPGAFLLHTAPNVRKVGEGDTRSSASGRRRARGWFASPSRSASATASARSAARAACPTRRSSRCSVWGWSTSRSSAGRRRSRRPRSRRSRRSPGRTSCPSASGSSASRTSARATVGIDGHGNSVYHDVQAAAEEAGGALCPTLTSTAGWAFPRGPKPRATGLTHVIDKGLNLRDIEGCSTPPATSSTSSSSAGGRATSRDNLEKKIALYRSFKTPVVCGGTLFEASTRAGAWTSSSVAGRAAVLARRDLGRDDRDPARAQARADRRLRAGLHRPLRGGLEGRRRQLRAVPLGRVDEGGLERAPGR